MGKKITDSEIITQLLNKLRYSANEFAQSLGYKSSSSVYNVIKDIGGAKISASMVSKIMEVYPNVNHLFLAKGQLPILVGGSMNEPPRELGSLLNFATQDTSDSELPETLKNIEFLLGEILEEMRKK